MVWVREKEEAPRWKREAEATKAADTGISGVESFFSGAGDALTFGFGDELLGLGAGLIGMDGEEITNWSRMQQADAQRANPWLYGGGQIATALIPGFAAGGVLRGAMGAASFANAAKNVGLLGRIGAAGAAGGASVGTCALGGNAPNA